MQQKLSVQAYSNNDDATIIIPNATFIKDCHGFAIFRKRKGETDLEAEPLLTSVGFEGDPHTPEEMRPSTQWPIQKYMWSDYFVKTGDEICYKVIPMINTPNGLVKDMERASEWSAWLTIGNSPGNEAYFNRGLVSSQFVSRRLANVPDKDRSKELSNILADEKSPLKQFMGGNLLAALYSLLETIAETKTLKVYGALYECNEPGLIRRLNKIGRRANIILANGAFSEDNNDPEKESADLLTKVNLTRRIVGTPHFAHNKFLVITQTTPDKVETPIKVWTGSTNWTTNGLHTQVNNAVVINDTDVAKYYKEEWDEMLKDCDNEGKGLYGKDFKKFNGTVKQNQANTIRTYFTPVGNQIDMDEADKYINAATKGILFLMFKPGVITGAKTKSRLLYNTILEKAKDRNLLVNGVINADPGGKDYPTIAFLHKNKYQEGDMDVALPASIADPFEFWTKEMGKKNVTIHSKVILIDPFSDNPVLITGSHNMGGKASKSNDDNLNLIIGNKELARAYAIHMTAVYHHYRWRFYRSAETTLPKWSGNVKSDIWQKWYATGEKAREIRFWTT
ncbi:phospholipase D-like domain-containing protein [Mucilaginibacter calamicampi]|uniref:phospholipase D n=1 Tax=Mucilaginibacter calamicampi TaxID=1302352 RepID=A0ABW2YW69_9SPHI